MPDPQSDRDLIADLEATAESIRVDAERLADIEATKADLMPADPRHLELSVSAEELAERVTLKTRAERALSRKVTGKRLD